MTNQTNEIINSVKRLERAGSEHSRVTEKLRQSAADVLSYPYDTLPDNFYGSVVVDDETYKVTKTYHEGWKQDLYDGDELYVEGVTAVWRPSWDRDKGRSFQRGADLSRDAALKIARFVACDAIAQLAAQVEQETEEAIKSEIVATSVIAKV